MLHLPKDISALLPGSNQHNNEKPEGPGIANSPTEMTPAEHSNGYFAGQNESEDSGSNSDAEDEEEGEEEEEDEEEDEDEPALKYERMGGTLSDLLKKDTASTLSISNKLLVSI